MRRAPESTAFAIGVATVTRLLDLPPRPGVPGTFAMSDVDVLCAELTEAGFTDVTVTTATAPFRFRTVERYIEVTRSLVAPELLERAAGRFGSLGLVWDAVAEAVAPYRKPGGGLKLPSTARCVRAER